MTGNVQVNTDQLRTHAANISHATGSVAEAENAGQQVTPGGFDNAFGLICQFFPTLVKPAADILITAITETGDALRNAQQNVGSVASAYDQTEEQVQQSLQQIKSTLDGTPTGPVISGGSGGSGGGSAPITPPSPVGPPKIPPAPIVSPIGGPQPQPIPEPQPIREPQPPVMPIGGPQPQPQPIPEPQPPVMPVTNPGGSLPTYPRVDPNPVDQRVPEDES